MIKSVFAATAALSVSAGAAFAGYVNVETNAGFGPAMTTLRIDRFPPGRRRSYQ